MVRSSGYTAVGIVSISQFLANLQVFPFLCQFNSRHLGFNTNIEFAHYRPSHHWVIHSRKYGRSRWNFVSSIVRSLDIRAISCSPKWWVGWLPLPPPRWGALWNISTYSFVATRIEMNSLQLHESDFAKNAWKTITAKKAWACSILHSK